jgi:hypothetical protein
MKRILTPLTFLSATILSALVAKADFEITEGPNGLTTTIPGVTITGSQDNWTVTAPAGSAFGIITGHIQILLTEPQGEPSYNLVTATQLTGDGGTFTAFTWESDLTSQQLEDRGIIPGSGTPPIVPIPNDLLNFIPPFGGGMPVTMNDTGDAPTGVPDTSSTLLLTGLGLFGIVLVGRSGALAQATQA